MEAAAKELADYMNKLALLAYPAGRLQHLEFVLWHAIVIGPFQYGQLTLTHAHIKKLRELSYTCNGWIYRDPVAGETWVSLTQWQDLYSRKIDLVALK
ncbi:hypothetical protein H0A36_08255 [Endozoicomonas sp. SM1973]|uniref:Uncharacterized protein n=1 Tax=Spartinivicinus marinus TaxID=2994442 RepID=A0A853I7D7_9GAMM|nr:hypothetical protein [Spartinivicinus marinus]MCX4025283.1 hypothetical protein [Spartinivicinus marinus]NYZ66004.1 hypothetical protein [Spartinivicinus marinus]